VQAQLAKRLLGPLAAALLMAAPAQAAPSDEVYTVGNYPVDAQAKDAVAAKDKALADGQEAAFHSLLKRIVPVTAYDRLKRLSTLQSGDFFEGVSVRSERNSRTRYIASLDFSFRADAVRAVLRQQGIPFVEEQAKEVVVVPLVRDANGTLIDKGSAARNWSGIWKTLDLDHSLTPIDLQSLKPGVEADTVTKLMKGAGDARRTIASAYATPLVVLAIAEPDAASKRMHVTLAGVDAAGAINLRRSYRVYDGDTGYAMELAAVVGQGVLEGRWKAQKVGANLASLGAPVEMQAQYASLAEWRQMREKLLAMAGVQDMRIAAESARGASLSLRYPGGVQPFAAALNGQGLALFRGGDGLILRAGTY
jgi:Uncharacterized protein conserved in bacteria (DUF2066)